MPAGDRQHVADIMTAPVETISSDDTVREAARVMRTENINSLLVPGTEVGILTGTDILDAVAAGHDLDELRVADVMTMPVESISEEIQLHEAVAMMTNYTINHLPVRDYDGDYVGMVSSTDLNEALANG
jgi:IMP dehydrogenase